MVDTDTFSSRIHLYAAPSFLKGIARLIDPFRLLNRYNQSRSPNEADYYALLSDWKTVGDDIEYAIEEYENSLQQER